MLALVQIPMEIFVTVISLLGGGLIALLAFLTKQVLQINDAVNHRHKRADSTGKVPSRLFDNVIDIAETTQENRANIAIMTQRQSTMTRQVEELVEWKRGYDGSKLQNKQAIDRLFIRLKTIEKISNDLIDRPPCKHYDPDFTDLDIEDSR